MSARSRAIADEYNNDPLTRGYAGMTSPLVAADMNSLYSPTPRTKLYPVTKQELVTWGFGREGLSKLKDASNRVGWASGFSDTNVAKGISGLAMLTDVDTLDLNDPDVIDIIDQMITATIFAAQDKTDLIAAGTRDVSRATELGFPNVTPAEIQTLRGEI